MRDLSDTDEAKDKVEGGGGAGLLLFMKKYESGQSRLRKLHHAGLVEDRSLIVRHNQVKTRYILHLT